MIDSVKNIFAISQLLFSILFLNGRIQKALLIILCLVGITLVINLNSDIKRIFTFAKPTTTEIENEISENTTSEIIIKKGDNLSSILIAENIDRNDAQEIIKLAKAKKLTSLKIGNKITFEYDINLTESEDKELNTETRNLKLVSFEIDRIKSANIIKTDDGFIAEINNVPLTKLVTKYEVNIKSSVIASLRQAGLSTNSIINLIKTYSHQIDFQRQIKTGDKITVITEKFVTPDSKFSHHGEIIYANIETRGNEHKIYKYSPNSKKENYQFFSYNGQSTKSSLLKTPVKVVRISSKFGYRKKHPVHGYGAMHKGVDFAAPVGTPIYSAGKGTVNFIGWKSGYGRIIIIKHGNGIATAYAHASKFAKNLKKGSKVRQGQIVAFVGKSGNVTGPHLHYEVRVNNKQVNPSKFKSTPTIKLKGKQLAQFNEFKKHIAQLESKLNGDIDIAANNIKNINLF